jgi:alanine or glycine:cation symporter, AGCS family
MVTIINEINGIIWSPVLIYLCLGAGLYFSVRTRFLQVRHVKHMLKIMLEGKSSAAGVSSFQALAISLSGRVGVGNIAGVATAITFGGPGAIFWMWVVAFLGASTAYIESTLAQIYKEKDEKGLYRGGPAYYIDKAMGQKWYAWIFAVATVVAMGFCLPGIQANSITAGVNTAWDISPMITASIIVAGLALVIVGGIRRIAKFAEIVVPFMAIGYMLIAMTVLLVNADKVPGVIALIINSALNFESGYGAILGMAVQWGVKRGIYSNEAGQGSGPHAAAAAEVSHPAKQGLVQAFSVYIDTLFICSATAFMILITGTYNVRGEGNTFLHEGLPGATAGPAYAQNAIETLLPGMGSSVLAIALIFFALTTIVAYYYIAETNIAYINRKVHRPWLTTALKVLLLASVFYGGINTAEVAWGLGDIGVGMMSWMNIIAILILQKPALLALKDYEDQLKEGREPTYRLAKKGSKEAEIWGGH